MTSPTDPPSVTSIALQTGLVSLSRVLLWLMCRKYLLRALYADIQGLSTDAPAGQSQSSLVTPVIQVEPPTPVTSSRSQDIELESLPPPSTALPIRHGSGALSVLKHASPLALARTSFALCFEESCILFLMLMAQTTGIMTAEARLLNWQISLIMLVMMNMVAIPLLMSHSLTSRSNSTSPNTRPTTKRSAMFRFFIASLPVSVYLFLLSYIPLPSGVSMFNPVQSVLARLTVLGTIILGLLSGFGAVSNAWTFLPAKLRHNDKEPTDADVEASQRSLDHIREDLASRRSALQKQTSNAPSTSATWFSSVLPSLRTDSAAMQELRGLEALEADMSRNNATLRQRRDMAKAASTPFGRIQTLSGRVLAIYCVFRTLDAALNVVYPRQTLETRSPDFLSGLLAKVLEHLPVETLRNADPGALARQIGLAFIGWILLGSARSLLRGASRVLRLTRGASRAGLLLLTLAQLMVTYVLSTLVQLRSSFVMPSVIGPDDAQMGKSLLESLPPCDVFGILFDRMFIIGALGGGILRWMDERVNG